MPAVWLMIGIIFATLTISTGYYYISPYVTEVFGVSALGAVLSSSFKQYIRPICLLRGRRAGQQNQQFQGHAHWTDWTAIALVIIWPFRPPWGPSHFWWPA